MRAIAAGLAVAGMGVVGLAVGLAALMVSVVEVVADSSASPAHTGLAVGGDGPAGVVATGELVTVRGIRVHASIGAAVEGLLAAAAEDGVVLGGWGWRSHADQIRLRRQHCGTTPYAVWEMPSSQCRPPTARPGRSLHEQGLAIDFTCNGQTITRGSACFGWLAANAARYGLFNLASEPWHWSTTGR